MLSVQHWVCSKCQDTVPQGKDDVWITLTLTLTLTLKLLGTENDSFCFLCSQHVILKWPHRLQVGPGETPEMQMISQEPRSVYIAQLPFDSVILS